jgi:hypothetical protein
MMYQNMVIRMASKIVYICRLFVIDIIGGEEMREPFQGESMFCYECHKIEDSHPDIESGWTVIESVDSMGYSVILYFCPACWVRINTLLEMVYNKKTEKETGNE